MINRVTDYDWAYFWAKNIGDVEIMWERMGEEARDHFKTFYQEKLPEHLR